MENKAEQGLINDRINGLEKRIGTVDRKVDDLEDKVDDIKDKNDERHVEMVRLTTELKGSSKATEQNTNRMANSIEGLVDELKQSNSRTDARFNEVNAEVKEVKDKVDGKEFDKTIQLEEKKLSNKVIVGLIGGGFIILELIIKVIAPSLGLG
jgi:peptidoglycan hydrolase CwlO-like protein